MSAAAPLPELERRTLHHACGHRLYWESPPKVLGPAAVLRLSSAPCPWCGGALDGRRAPSTVDAVEFRMPSGHAVYVYRTRAAQLGAQR